MPLLKKLIVLSFLLFAGQHAHPRDKPIISSNHRCIESDKLGNIYLVADFEITKYNSSGKMLSRYSNKGNGKIAGMDASNPMKLLVFYRDFSMVLFLDNMLNVQGDPIAFEMVGMPRVTLACTGFDNSLWVYDSDGFELKRLNNKLEATGKSGNLFTILKKEVKPLSLQEHLNQLYMLGNDSVLYVFDAFGSYIKSWKMPCAGSARVNSRNIYQLCDNTLVIFDSSSLSFTAGPLPVEGCIEMSFSGEFMWLGDGENVFRMNKQP